MRNHFVLVLVLVVWGFCCREPVYADGVSRALSLAVAQVAAHEGALMNLRDVDLIWQCVQSHGDTAEKRLRWLQGHSPRALGLEPARAADGNAWAPELGEGTAVPASVAAGGDRRSLAYWRVKVMPRWTSVLERAQMLVRGAAYERPCAIEPYSWGGPMDHEGAARRGLYPIGCEGTLNDGFATEETLEAAYRRSRWLEEARNQGAGPWLPNLGGPGPIIPGAVP